MTRHLATLNVARMRGPMHSPVMAGFVEQLAAINAIADAAPGFIWRLIEEDPADPALRSLGPLMLVNMSVWQSAQALRAYVYRSAHVEVFRQRERWFLPMPEANAVLWWVPEGHIPTLQQALDSLATLRERGPGPEGFTFSSLQEP